MNLTHQKLYLLGLLLSLSLVLIFLKINYNSERAFAKNYKNIYDYQTKGIVSSIRESGVEADFKDTNLYSFNVSNRTLLGKLYKLGDTVPVRYNTMNPELAIIELESQISGPYEQTQTLINIVLVALISSGVLLFLALFNPVIYENLASFVVVKKDNFLY